MPTSTASSRSPVSRRLLRLYRRLLKHFGPRHWWPADNAWEMMVGAILTQNTNWINVEKALEGLKTAKALSVKKIAALPLPRLEKLIRSSGFFRQKAARLRAFARYMLDNPAFYKQLRGLTSPPAPLTPAGRSALRRAGPMGEGRRQKNPLLSGEGGRRRRPGEVGISFLRKKLLSLNGIGPETADSILLYAGGYPIFVVDAYTRRIGQRLGLFSFNDYGKIQNYFQSALHPSPPPPSAKATGGLPSAAAGEGGRGSKGEGSSPSVVRLYNEYHALLVQLAKAYCRRRDPKCGACPLMEDCRFGRKRKN